MLAFRRMVGSSSTFYELYFRFYFIVVLRSETSVAFKNEHLIPYNYATTATHQILYNSSFTHTVSFYAISS
jgi:hypothetical protein